MVFRAARTFWASPFRLDPGCYAALPNVLAARKTKAVFRLLTGCLFDFAQDRLGPFSGTPYGNFWTAGL
jgi:hypothetical protein